MLIFLFLTSVASLDLTSLQSYPNSECIKLALSPILPQCTKGIEAFDPRLRRVLAIKLSICEFENSGLYYPPACDNIDSESYITNCISSLEQSPQYWTTYSGYYRELHTICYEQSLPYEKDNLINLFSNITIIYTEFFSELKKSKAYSDDVHLDMVEKLENLERMMNAHLKTQEGTIQKMDINMDQYNEKMISVLEASLSSMQSNLELYNSHIIGMESYLDGLNLDMAQIVGGIARIKDILNDGLQNIQSLSNEAGLALKDILSESLMLKGVTIENTQNSRNLQNLITSDLLGISSQLKENSNHILIQKQAISSEFKNILLEHSRELDIYLGGVLSQYSQQFASFVNHSMNIVDTKLNETINKMNVFDKSLNRFMYNVGNLTETVNGGVLYVKDMMVFKMFSNLRAVMTLPLLRVGFLMKGFGVVIIIALFMQLRLCKILQHFLNFAAVVAVLGGVGCSIFVGFILQKLTYEN